MNSGFKTQSKKKCEPDGYGETDLPAQMLEQMSASAAFLAARRGANAPGLPGESRT